MKSATIIIKTKGTKMRVELRTIHTTYVPTHLLHHHYGGVKVTKSTFYLVDL